MPNLKPSHFSAPLGERKYQRNPASAAAIPSANSNHQVWTNPLRRSKIKVGKGRVVAISVNMLNSLGITTVSNIATVTKPKQSTKTG